MDFEDVHDFQRVALVPEEDDVVPEGEAADVRAQFRPRPAKLARKRGKLQALSAKPPTKRRPTARLPLSRVM